VETKLDTETEQLATAVVDAAVKVHTTLGPGFLEGVYQNALRHELDKRSVQVSPEVVVDILYDGLPVGQHRFDLVISDKVIVELNTVEALSKAHYAQARSYLKASGIGLALLINFSGATIDIRRVVQSR
jgi:GxxExxY protein